MCRSTSHISVNAFVVAHSFSPSCFLKIQSLVLGGEPGEPSKIKSLFIFCLHLRYRNWCGSFKTLDRQLEIIVSLSFTVVICCYNQIL